MVKNGTYPRVSVIILNWNGWDDTLECLESLYRINYPKYDVVLVDNNSTDDSIHEIKNYCRGQLEIESKYFEFKKQNKPIKIIEFVEEELKSITPQDYSIRAKDASNKILNLIRNQDNYGFAKGNNLAAKKAYGKYILFLNSDTKIFSDSLENAMTRITRDQRIGVLGVTLLNGDHSIQSSVFRFPSLRLFFAELLFLPIFRLFDDYRFFRYDRERTVDFVSGAFMLLARKIFQQIHGNRVRFLT